ncbi:MAG: TatD family hydrolase [Candidatus Diapherotrites archaeon]|jgi:TatD DNase family protein|uniref:TatD family hydrolase n=1 Tax=Candidatus Iainarchaeum sp. TaxID=3101447 RepID=A0A8T5GF65_9ARCH|nr:TatD family hydrolase [Candidatus Diapherotrites archaeon]
MIKMFYDSHAHINMLTKKELEEMLERTKDKNVDEIISCSTSFESNKQNLLLSKKFPQIKAAIGLYPLDAMELEEKELDRAFGFFEKHIKEVKAIGEVGMDYKYCKTDEDKEKQKDIFIRFIELGKKYDKPLIIHSRYAQRQVIETLEKEDCEKVLLHSFVDSKKLMLRAANNNWFVGVGMSVLFNEQVQRNISEFPIENLLLETDSPIRFDGKKAMSDDIISIANKVASLKEIEIGLIEKRQEANYTKLFE